MLRWIASATDKAPALTNGSGCLGDTVTEPVGATYKQVYGGNYDPKIKDCGTSFSGRGGSLRAWSPGMRAVRQESGGRHFEVGWLRHVAERQGWPVLRSRKQNANR